jgi:DNA-binding response OmpR family regulator
MEAPVKVLVVEARDRVKGLQMVGDDDPVKPFAFDEPAARIAALVRREPPILRTGRGFVE